MGGLGSGSYRVNKRPVKENCLILQINKIIHSNFNAIGNERLRMGTWSWRRDDKLYGILAYRIEERKTLILDYIAKNEEINQSIILVTTIQPQGGKRYWALCPRQQCMRLCANLYLPVGRKIFACRKCYNLTYRSSNQSHQLDWLYGRIAFEDHCSMALAKAKWIAFAKRHGYKY